uniref:L1 transposable element RRM domain-containing protein n=1 Tax=Anolis carolinensis TaxID=28377 RepID=A0A803T314_ANOCA
MKQEIESLNQDLKELKRDKKELREAHDKIQREVERMDIRTIKLEDKQERIESKELEYQLRFRNIWEDSKEDIRKTTIEIISNMLQCPIEEAEDRTDRVYRINTNYAKRNKTPRDVIVNFTKKIFRDEILKANNDQPVIFKGKKIAILKEYPTETLNRRRKYLFLTDELKKHNLRHKSWSRIDMFWVSKQITLCVKKVTILPRQYSDHCPLELIINQKENSWRWKLDGNLLKKKEDIERNRKILEEFLKLNNKHETPPFIIWDVSKATMRGYFLQ